MRRLPITLIATLILMTSQQSMAQTGNEFSTQPIATRKAAATAATVTRSVPARVGVQRIPKFKVLRSNPYRYSKLIIDDLEYEVDDEGLMSPYRRRDLNKVEPEDDYSDRVRWRLFLARQLALLKYREKWA